MSRCDEEAFGELTRRLSATTQRLEVHMYQITGELCGALAAGAAAGVNVSLLASQTIHDGCDCADTRACLATLAPAIVAAGGRVRLTPRSCFTFSHQKVD